MDPRSPSSDVEPFIQLDTDDSVTVSSITFTEAPGSGAHESTPSSWATRARICHGIRLHGMIHGNPSSITYSRYPVAIPTDSIMSDPASTNEVIVASTASHPEVFLMKLGMSKQAARDASVWTSFVDAIDSLDDEGPAIHVVCRRPYTRMTVTTELEELQPHPQFVAAIERVVALPNREKQLEGMKRVLRQWGAVIATQVEMGCSLVTSHTFVTPCLIPLFGNVYDSLDKSAYRGAEKLLKHAVHCLFSPNAPGESEDEVKAYVNFSRTLTWKVNGGTSNTQLNGSLDSASLEQDRHWKVIGVDRVYSVLELLRSGHAGLYESCQNLVASCLVKAAVVPAPSPPIFTYVGRQVTYSHGNRDHYRLNGYSQYVIPHFDPTKDFTLSGWVASGSPGTTSIALNLECDELKESLLAMGEWDKNGNWQVIRATPYIKEGGHRAVDYIWLKAHKEFKVGPWQHIAFCQTLDRLAFYLNGRLTATAPASKHSAIPVSEVRLSLGRGVFERGPTDQWDGAIEKVKLWTRALGYSQIAEDALEIHQPLKPFK